MGDLHGVHQSPVRTGSHRGLPRTYLPMRFTYVLFTYLLSPLYARYWIFRGFANRAYWDRLGQRLGCRYGSENAEGRGRVPALVIVMRMHGAGEAVLDLKPDSVSIDNLPPGQAALFSEREQRGHERHRLMAAQDRTEIVVVEGM